MELCFSLHHVGPLPDLVEGGVLRLEVLAELLAARSLVAAGHAGRVMVSAQRLVVASNPEVVEFSDRCAPVGRLRATVRGRLTEVFYLSASYDGDFADVLSLRLDGDLPCGRLLGDVVAGMGAVPDGDAELAREVGAFLAADVPRSSELQEMVERRLDFLAQDTGLRVRLVLDGCPTPLWQAGDLVRDRLVRLAEANGADMESLSVWG